MPAPDWYIASSCKFSVSWALVRKQIFFSCSLKNMSSSCTWEIFQDLGFPGTYEMRFVVIHRPTWKGGWTWSDLKTSTCYSCSCGLQRRNASSHLFSPWFLGKWIWKLKITILYNSDHFCRYKYNITNTLFDTFFYPRQLFFNIQHGTVRLGIGQPHVGSYIPSGIVETSNLPITNMAFVMLCPVAMVLQFDGVMVAIAFWSFCSGFQAEIRGK